MQILSIVGLLVVGLISCVESQKANNCGDISKHTIVLESFSLKPSPLKRPVLAEFNLMVDIKQDLADPIKTTIDLKKKILIWFTVPCTDNVGSCTYNSWCDLCKTCTCPLKAGKQQLIMHMNLTTAVPDGEYKTQINFLSATGQTGCVTVEGINVQ